MGMSGDFEVAIEEGATMVRVGTAIFGPRPRAAAGMSVKGKRLGFVGCGNMGEALVKGLVEASVVPGERSSRSSTRATTAWRELDQRYGVRCAKNNVELVRETDVVLLAVKPQIMAPVLSEIAPSLSRRQLVDLDRRRRVDGDDPRRRSARTSASSA